jgi:hypothetical protein
VRLVDVVEQGSTGPCHVRRQSAQKEKEHFGHWRSLSHEFEDSGGLGTGDWHDWMGQRMIDGSTKNEWGRGREGGQT